MTSRFQIGDKVRVVFCRPAIEAEVLAVKFSESKVHYDVQLKFALNKDPDPIYTRVDNVDSAFVEESTQEASDAVGEGIE